MANLPEIMQGNLRKFRRKFLKELHVFGVTFKPETLGNRPKALKTLIIA